MSSATLRGFLKSAAERALGPAAEQARRRQGRRGSAVILAYHNVVEAGEAPAGDLSLHIPADAFLDQMERLARTHEIVPLRELVTTSGGATARPRAAVTFDDAYRGAVRIALPLLAEQGIPATVFVPPALLGTDAFWWDALARAGGLEEGARRRALTIDRGRPQVGEKPVIGTDLRPATAEELLIALQLPGIEAAAHSWSHPNLTRLADAELRDELERPRAWLRDHAPAPVLDHLSFPYGLWDERVLRAAADAGFRFVYRVEGGVASVGSGRSADAAIAVLPRVNVPAGLSGRGFELRAAGLLAGRSPAPV